jgi:dTMP kinase
MFVTFEGIDGSGKSTQAELLRTFLAERGEDVVLAREPGGTPLGEEIRTLLLRGPAMTAWAEAALFAAARVELVENVIRPALERRAHVVCDRYLDSSLAYQGIARGLGVERVLELNTSLVGDLLPERTFVLSIEPGEALQRLPGAKDRLEREGGGFMADVAAAYAELAARFPERITLLDGSLAVDELAKAVREELSLAHA